MERIRPSNIKTVYILLHVVLWCICIQRSKQQRDINPNMPSRNHPRGTSSTEEVCLRHEGSGRFLRVRGRSLIDAVGEDESDDSLLIIETLSLNGTVSIRGKNSRFYLCVNKRGDIVGRRRLKEESNLMCVFFMHQLENSQYVFEPLQFTGMYVGFKKDGEKKNANKVNKYKNASHFTKDCENYRRDRTRAEEFHRMFQETLYNSATNQYS